jgi:nucleoside-diphosphate-sugar epimerase
VKRDAELSALSYSPALPLTIVRPPAVYGPWDKTLLKLFRAVLRGAHVVPGNGASRMSMVHVEDLAEAIVEASHRGERAGGPSDSSERGVYFVSGEEHPTYGELGALVASAMDAPSPRVIELPRFAARWAATAVESVARLRGRSTVLSRDKILEAHSGHWTCSSEKAARDLSWRPSQPLRSHLRDTAAWYRAHGWL